MCNCDIMVLVLSKISLGTGTTCHKGNCFVLTKVFQVIQGRFMLSYCACSQLEVAVTRSFSSHDLPGDSSGASPRYHKLAWEGAPPIVPYKQSPPRLANIPVAGWEVGHSPPTSTPELSVIKIRLIFRN